MFKEINLGCHQKTSKGTARILRSSLTNSDSTGACLEESAIDAVTRGFFFKIDKINHGGKHVSDGYTEDAGRGGVHVAGDKLIWTAHSP
jgi:hypothetical protein